MGDPTGSSSSGDAVQASVVDEATTAFGHNADIVKEMGYGVMLSAVAGTLRVGAAYIKHRATTTR